MIRLATLADAEPIAQVHVASWRTTYAGIMPDELLANLSVERRTASWQRMLANPEPGSCIWVAEADGQIVGFGSGGPEREGDPGYTGELYAVYLLQEQQRKGLGRQLFEAVARHVKATGHSKMLLWVAAENQPTRRFYERMGGIPLREKSDQFGGKTISEIAYGYDLDAILPS